MIHTTRSITFSFSKFARSLTLLAVFGLGNLSDMQATENKEKDHDEKHLANIRANIKLTEKNLLEYLAIHCRECDHLKAKAILMRMNELAYPISEDILQSLAQTVLYNCPNKPSFSKLLFILQETGLNYNENPTLIASVAREAIDKGDLNPIEELFKLGVSPTKGHPYAIHNGSTMPVSLIDKILDTRKDIAEQYKQNNANKLLDLAKKYCKPGAYDAAIKKWDKKEAATAEPNSYWDLMCKMFNAM